jgi:hypothetical protein
MRALAIFCLFFASGCTHRPAAPGALSFVVGPECHASAIEKGCDSSAVPRCAQIALRYDKGCEKLQAH